jgi:hypothetical protein
MEENIIVLPDTLVAQLIGNAATLNDYLQQEFAEIIKHRDPLRKRLIEEGMILKANKGDKTFASTFSIDGAENVEVDRANAYSVSCAVCVGTDYTANEQSSCLALLPHVECLKTLSSGLMMMQEIIMTVEACEKNPNAVCFIDGSKISMIIRINQFYTGILRDLPGQVDYWRKRAVEFPENEPGKTLQKFESRDWLSEYLLHPRIVGNLKLVTTTTLLEQYIPQWVGKFDDKTLAALVLEENEYLKPVPLPIPSEPFHVRGMYPFFESINSIEKELYSMESNHQIFHIYYRPRVSHGVFKIEANKRFIRSKTGLERLFNWWQYETCAPDLLEPFSFVLVDKFAKEGVRVAATALHEITRRCPTDSEWAWYLTQPYRTK